MLFLFAIVVAVLCAALLFPSELDDGLSPEARARKLFGGERDACRATSMWHHW